MKKILVTILCAVVYIEILANEKNPICIEIEAVQSTDKVWDNDQNIAKIDLYHSKKNQNSSNLQKNPSAASFQSYQDRQKTTQKSPVTKEGVSKLDSVDNQIILSEAPVTEESKERMTIFDDGYYLSGRNSEFLLAPTPKKVIFRSKERVSI
jgi:hypothetical protein